MKIIISAFFVCGFIFFGISSSYADGCYLCTGGGYVKYEGEDTFDLRKQAKTEFGCEVTGTSSSCNPNQTKGTVKKEKK